MCDVTNQKRKLLHRTQLEANKTLKGIFRKDDLDESLSTSEWGLEINDSYRHRKRNRCVKLNEEPLTLICEWNTCYQTFTKFASYNNHLTEHIQEYNAIEVEGSFPCCWLRCSYIAKSFKDLNQHICYHGYHTKLKSVGKNVEERQKLPECIQSEHFVIPVVPNGYLCQWEYCNKTLETVFDFLEHVRVHVYHNPKSRKEGSINCCWKGCANVGKFISQYKLAEHLRIHTKEKIIACPQCGHLFSNKTKFCDHRRRQLPISLQSYLCSQCSKYFPSERLLRDHMRLHINHYKCSMCEMTCPKPSILAKHIRYRHLNEKPFKCNKCNYRCVSKHNLDFHLKKHDPNSQFHCNDCSYKCRSSFGLERHYQKLHGKEWNNVYECHICKKQFARGGLLTKHLMKIHNYHWPSGHSRFRYKEDQDGLYRLQTVRYETLDVTEEIIKGTIVQPPTEQESLKFDIQKRNHDNNFVDKFDVIFLSQCDKNSQSETTKKVVITIDDIDTEGNVLKSRTIQSSEVICSGVKTSNDNNDSIVVLNNI